MGVWFSEFVEPGAGGAGQRLGKLRLAGSRHPVEEQSNAAPGSNGGLEEPEGGPVSIEMLEGVNVEERRGSQRHQTLPEFFFGGYGRGVHRLQPFIHVIVGIGGVRAPLIHVRDPDCAHLPQCPFDVSPGDC